MGTVLDTPFAVVRSWPETLIWQRVDGTWQLDGSTDLLVESAGTTGQSKFHNIPRPDNFAALLYKVREERSVSMQGGTVVQAADADPTEQLQRLKKLHDDGILTDEEYEAKRQKLVDEI